MDMRAALCLCKSKQEKCSATSKKTGGEKDFFGDVREVVQLIGRPFGGGLGRTGGEKTTEFDQGLKRGGG